MEGLGLALPCTSLSTPVSLLPACCLPTCVPSHLQLLQPFHPRESPALRAEQQARGTVGTRAGQARGQYLGVGHGSAQSCQAQACENALYWLPGSGTQDQNGHTQGQGPVWGAKHRACPGPGFPED